VPHIVDSIESSTPYRSSADPWLAPRCQQQQTGQVKLQDFETDIVVQSNQKVTVKTELKAASITAEDSELK